MGMQRFALILSSPALSKYFINVNARRLHSYGAHHYRPPPPGPPPPGNGKWVWVPYLGHPPARPSTTSSSSSSDDWDDDGWDDDGLEKITAPTKPTWSGDGWGNDDHLVNMPTPKPWTGDDWDEDGHDWDDNGHVVILPIEPPSDDGLMPPSPLTTVPPMVIPPPPTEPWNDDGREGNGDEDTLPLVMPPSPNELRNDDGREGDDIEKTTPTDGPDEEEEEEKDVEESVPPPPPKIVGSQVLNENAGKNPDAIDAVPIGAVIGAVVAATVLAVGLVLFAKRKRSAANAEKEIDPEEDDTLEEAHFIGDPNDPDADIPPPPPMQANNDAIEMDESFLNLDVVSEAIEEEEEAGAGKKSVEFVSVKFDDLESV